MPQFTEEMLQLLKAVHVNMPWKYFHRYREMILGLRMNIEIGFGAEEMTTVPRSELQQAARELHKRGCRISLHAPFWDLAPGSLDPLIREVTYLRLQQFLDLLTIFEPVAVVCHTGFDPRHHRGHRNFWIEKSLQSWESLVVRAEASRVPLLVENVWEEGPEFHRDLFDRLGSAFFGFCLDVGHQHSFSTTPLAHWLEALKDRLREVHLHDNDGTRDAHLPIGRGTIDFPLLFRFLRRECTTPPLLTLEPHDESHLPDSLAGLGPMLERSRLLEPAGGANPPQEAASWPA